MVEQRGSIDRQVGKILGEAPRPRRRPLLSTLLVVVTLALLVALTTLIGAMFLAAGGDDPATGSRLWFAAAVALVVALVVPLLMAIKLAKSALGAVRLVALWDVLVALALAGLAPDRAQRALLAHGGWPTALFGSRSTAWGDGAAAIARLIPGGQPAESTSAPATAPGTVVDGGAGSQPAGTLSPSAVFAATADAVVYIGVRAAVEPGSVEAKMLEFLGLKELEGHGSGFLVSADGLIVSNDHVVQRARSAEVRLRDGRIFREVTVLALDPGNDLALIQIAGAGFKPIALAPSDDVAVGAAAYAIGSPLGLDFTLTSGIISARREQQQTSMLQMQTAIAPGSSGGPVLDDQARLIGVSTATYGGVFSFAVHVRHVRTLLTAPRQAKPLEPWLPGIELVALEIVGQETLPTERAQIEHLVKFAARAVEGCLKNVPVEGARVEVTLPGSPKAKPELTTNLSADSDKCLVPALHLIAMQTMLLSSQLTPRSRISCSFKGLNVSGDSRPPEQRMLALQFAASAAAASTATSAPAATAASAPGSAPASDGGATADAAGERAALQKQVNQMLRDGPPIRRWPKAEAPPKPEKKRGAGKRGKASRNP